MNKNSLVIYCFYPILAVIACSYGGYTWHEQLQHAEDFAYLTGDGRLNIFLVYYGAIISSTLASLFFDSRILRYSTFIFSCLFVFMLNQERAIVGITIVPALTLLLAIYPSSMSATAENQKLFLKRFFYAVSAVVITSKIHVLMTGNEFLTLHSFLVRAEAIEVYPSLAISVFGIHPILLHFLELLVTFNLIFAFHLLFSKRYQLVCFSLLVGGLLLNARFEKHMERYWPLLLLAAAAIVVHSEQFAENKMSTPD